MFCGWQMTSLLLVEDSLFTFHPLSLIKRKYLLKFKPQWTSIWSIRISHLVIITVCYIQRTCFAAQWRVFGFFKLKNLCGYADVWCPAERVGWFALQLDLLANHFVCAFNVILEWKLTHDVIILFICVWIAKAVKLWTGHLTWRVPVWIRKCERNA